MHSNYSHSKYIWIPQPVFRRHYLDYRKRHNYMARHALAKQEFLAPAGSATCVAQSARFGHCYCRYPAAKISCSKTSSAFLRISYHEQRFSPRNSEVIYHLLCSEAGTSTLPPADENPFLSLRVRAGELQCLNGNKWGKASYRDSAV